MDFTKDSIEAEEEVDYLPSDRDSDTNADSTACSSSPRQVAELALSPWEKWVIKKAQKEREKKERDRQLMIKEKEIAKALKKAQREKQRRSDKVYCEWLADKAKQQAASLQNEKSTQNERARESEEKKKIIEEKAKASYEEWCAKKQQEKVQQEKTTLEEQQRKTLIEQEKRARGAKAYRDWMRVNYDRPVETDWYGRMDERRTF